MSKKFLQGSVFEFYVPEIKKYCYCKFFDFSDRSAIHGLLAQVFDKFSDSGEIHLNELNECEPLFGHKSVSRYPQKKHGWKYLGVLYHPDDTVIPDFRQLHGIVEFVEDDRLYDKWYPIYGLNKSGPYCEYELVAHLERITLAATTLSIPDRTGLEYCRINNLDIGEHYDLDHKGVKLTYLEMINTPIYSKIPKEWRGRAKVRP